MGANFSDSTGLSVRCIVHQNFRPRAPETSEGRNFRPFGRNFRPEPERIHTLFFFLLFSFGLPDMSAYLCFLAYLFLYVHVVPLVSVPSVRPPAPPVHLRLLRLRKSLIRRPWPLVVLRLMSKGRRRRLCRSLSVQ